MAQQAIENYKFIEKPAIGINKATKFQDFELYKKTIDCNSQYQNDSDSQSRYNHVKHSSP